MWDKNTNLSSVIFIVSVDGIHCKIQEPRKEPSKSWYLHEYGQAGVVYELGIAIYESQIVWTNGPFQTSQIFNEDSLCNAIPAGKKSIGDSGYCNAGKKMSMPNTLDSKKVKTFKRHVWGPHKNLNAQIKSFKSMAKNFHHGKDNHQTIFEAICMLVQLDMENGHPLRDV